MNQSISSPVIGQKAENMALAYLQRQGMILLDRNYRSNRGEVDLIMQEDGTLVFVEVRYRKSDKYGNALESVNARKQARIIHAAQSYLKTYTARSNGYRFDVVGIKPDNDAMDINWIKHAFVLPS